MARYTIRGNVTVFRFASAPADAGSITAAEITGATDITGVAEGEALSGMEGWESSPSVIGTPDALSLETGNIPGETTFPVGQLSYYTDDATNAVWDLLVEGTGVGTGIFPNGTATGDDYTYFSTEVINRTRSLSMGNEAETHAISLAIRSRTEGTAVA